MSKFANGINSKNRKGDNKKYLNFHKVILSLHSISCPSLKPLAVKVTVFEVPSFL